MANFKFPEKRAARSVMGKTANPYKPNPAHEGEITVQGVGIGSQEELRVARALDRLGIRYDYQVPVDGGRELRGGQVVDFIVYNPFAQPVQVYGEYWHRGELGSEDELKLAVLERKYQSQVIILWAADLQSDEETVQVLRRELGL